jgi:hypothetical protein
VGQSVKKANGFKRDFGVWRSLGDTASAHRNTYKTGTNRLAFCADATTRSYHRSTAQRPSMARVFPKCPMRELPLTFGTTFAG